MEGSSEDGEGEISCKDSGKVNFSSLTPKQNEQVLINISRSDNKLDSDGPRKRRKTEEEMKASKADWDAFEHDVDDFSVQHLQNANKFAFSFVEGPLVKALRTGGWFVLFA
jgi:midasin (ATPase involved in ribosome maturation)